MIAKLRQIEDKEVVCAAAVFSLFLFLKFILFRLLGEYFVTVQSIINKCDGEDQYIYFLLMLLELLLGRSLHNYLRSQLENFMGVTDENQATDFGGTADVGDVRTTYWVSKGEHSASPGQRATHRDFNYFLFGIHLTESIGVVFSHEWA